MGSGARRIHTDFEREVVERLERIEKRLEHAGRHIPCLLGKPPEDWIDDMPYRHVGPLPYPPEKAVRLGPVPREGDERTGSGIGSEAVTIKGRIMQLPSRSRLVPDENESYGFIDDRGEVGMQDFDGGDSA